jgi:hypothetical protein
MKDETALIRLLEMISVGISISRNKMVKGKKTRFR